MSAVDVSKGTTLTEIGFLAMPPIADRHLRHEIIDLTNNKFRNTTTDVGTPRQDAQTAWPMQDPSQGRSELDRHMVHLPSPES